MDITAFTDRVEISRGLAYLLSNDKVYMGASPSADNVVPIYRSALDEMCSIAAPPTNRNGARTLTSSD